MASLATIVKLKKLYLYDTDTYHKFVIFSCIQDIK